MTNFEAESLFIGIIYNGFVDIPIAWPNRAFAVPNDGKFARVSFGSTFTLEREQGRGQAVHKQRIATMQFFTPLESGRSDILGWVDAVSELVTDYVSSDKAFMIGEPDVTFVGDDGYGKYQINLTIPHTYWVGNY
jgi:hypothetical protein